MSERLSERTNERLDERALSRLRWRCRRGLLENDLLIERFFARQPALTVAQGEAMAQLMELPDNDLLDLLLARKQPEGELDHAAVRDLLALMRPAPQNSLHD